MRAQPKPEASSNKGFMWACIMCFQIQCFFLVCQMGSADTALYSPNARQLLWCFIFHSGGWKGTYSGSPSRTCMSTCGCDEDGRTAVCVAICLCKSPVSLERGASKGKWSFSSIVIPHNSAPKLPSLRMTSDTQYIGIFYLDFTCGVKNPKNVLFTHPQYKFTRYLYMLKYSIV